MTRDCVFVELTLVDRAIRAKRAELGSLEKYRELLYKELDF